MTPEEVLALAAEDMATHGMTKRYYYGEGREDDDRTIAPACAYGSIHRTLAQRGLVDSEIVDPTDPLILQAAHLLAQTIRRPGNIFQVITAYNDADTTTAEDMILTMKRAAHGE